MYTMKTEAESMPTMRAGKDEEARTLKNNAL
jgi:hypothetical protein